MDGECRQCYAQISYRFIVKKKVGGIDKGRDGEWNEGGLVSKIKME